VVRAARRPRAPRDTRRAGGPAARLVSPALALARVAAPVGYHLPPRRPLPSRASTAARGGFGSRVRVQQRAGPRRVRAGRGGAGPGGAGRGGAGRGPTSSVRDAACPISTRGGAGRGPTSSASSRRKRRCSTPISAPAESVSTSPGPHSQRRGASRNTRRPGHVGNLMRRFASSRSHAHCPCPRPPAPRAFTPRGLRARALASEGGGGLARAWSRLGQRRWRRGLRRGRPCQFAPPCSGAETDAPARAPPFTPRARASPHASQSPRLKGRKSYWRRAGGGGGRGKGGAGRGTWRGGQRASSRARRASSLKSVCASTSPRARACPARPTVTRPPPRPCVRAPARARAGSRSAGLHLLGRGGGGRRSAARAVARRRGFARPEREPGGIRH
jgi:hypothetical protein